MKEAARIVLVTDGLDGQHGGVQRVTRAVMEAVVADPRPTLVWSLNDAAARAGAELPVHVGAVCFGGGKLGMVWGATLGPLPTGCRRVFCLHLALAPVGAWIARRLRCSLDVFLHGVEAWRPLPFPQRWALKRASLISANSRHTLERFGDANPEFRGHPSCVVSLGLNREHTLATPTRHPVMDQAPRFFLCVTRFAETYKGERTLLEAFRRIRQHHPGTHLVLVGEGPTRSRLREEARAAGLAETAHFVGAVSDSQLAALYDACEGFVLLSEGEGFGIVFVEAMYHGKPCLATNADAAREIVRDGETGLLVMPGDVAGTSAAMRRLLEDRALASRLGVAGRSLVRERFMPEQFIERLRTHLADA